MSSLLFISDPAYQLHTPPPGHPERPERTKYLIEHLRKTSLWKSMLHSSPGTSSDDDILAVHTHRHLDLVRNRCLNGGGLIDEGDTYVVEESFNAALRAAGAAITAVDSVLTNKSTSAFCAVRPPGHHAESNRPMGFCLFNNVAVAARYAQRRHGVGKIAIFDWDVHHGNGTQDIFYDDPSVLYISIHQYPFYPGTGAERESGSGEGQGFTLNYPLPAGTRPETYLDIVRNKIRPAVESFRPELLFISAGFDAHIDDPLGGMMLTDATYAEMTRFIRTDSPIISVLEGGYDLRGLATSVKAHLEALSAD